jgi:hypothetical protein
MTPICSFPFSPQIHRLSANLFVASDEINDEIPTIKIIPVEPVPSDEQIRKDYYELKNRMDQLELAVSTVVVTKPKGRVSKLIDLITSSTLELNAKTVEICSVISFFFIGMLISSTISRRLWLFGGIGSAWWASGAVHEDSRAGALSRRVGVQLAQIVRDINEKIIQFRIFYKTGKLAYHTSKIWEQYDQKFLVTQKMDYFKRLAMVRAAEFNDRLEKVKLSDQLSDMWRAVASAPDQARRLNNQYGVSSGVVKFGGHLLTSSKNFLSDVVGTVVANRRSGKGKKGRSHGGRYTPTNWFLQMLSGGSKGENDFRYGGYGFNYEPPKVEESESLWERVMIQTGLRQSEPQIPRSRLINPWVPVWMFFNYDKDKRQ